MAEHILAEPLPSERTLRLLSSCNAYRSMPPTIPGLCTWCDKQTDGRFCSNECKRAYDDRVVTSAMRDRVFERDRGVCALCGRDTTWLQFVVLSLRGFMPTPDILALARRLRGEKSHLSLCRHWWVVDHEIPVCVGGMMHGMDNLRTLCRRCNVEVTYAWRRENKGWWEATR